MRRCIYCAWVIPKHKVKCENCGMIHDEENNRMYSEPSAPFMPSSLEDWDHITGRLKSEKPKIL